MSEKDKILAEIHCLIDEQMKALRAKARLTRDETAECARRKKRIANKKASLSVSGRVGIVNDFVDRFQTQ